MSAYSEKFKDPRWQKKRLEIFEKDGWRCQHCKSDGNTLHAHHLCYISGFDPWDYENFFIVTLCENCHSEFHADPNLSEWFLLREFRMQESNIQMAEHQKSYDIGGIMRYLDVSDISIDSDYFQVCTVEVKLNKEDDKIEFKLIEDIGF